MKFSGLKILVAALFAVTASAAPVEKPFPDDRTLGDPKAPVVVVEYLAPMCPHCARYAATVFPEIKKAYIDTGKVLWVVRILPLGAPDGAVSSIAKCLGPSRYYEFIDLAFKKQPMWDPDGYQIPDVEAALVQLAGMAGMKPDDAKRCMKDEAEFDRLNRLGDDAAKRLDVKSVPSILIGGEVLVGGEEASFEVMKTKIDAQLAAEPKAPQKQAPTPHKKKHHKHHKHHTHSKFHPAKEHRR